MQRGNRERERTVLAEQEKRKKKGEQKKKKLELGWVARRWCRHSTGHGQINPDHVTLGVGVLAGPRNNRIARSVYQRALLRRQISRRYKRFHRSPLIYLVAPNSFLLFVSCSKFSVSSYRLNCRLREPLSIMENLAQKTRQRNMKSITIRGFRFIFLSIDYGVEEGT